jgi:hypothetical protein
VDWPFGETFESWQDTFEGLFERLRREAREGGVRALVTPVAPFNQSKTFSPVIAAAAVVSIVLLSGVALGAALAAAAALLAVYYLLTQVFGYELSVAVPGAA